MELVVIEPNKDFKSYNHVEIAATNKSIGVGCLKAYKWRTEDSLGHNELCSP